MERVEGPQTPFEVYCHDCRVTFAAGTPRCIHCGARLGKRGRDDRAPTLEEMEDEGAESSVLRRAGGITLWVLIALGAAITRMCDGGGA